MKNPIKDNRLVGDMTFAARFLDFVKDVEVGCGYGETEKEAMISYAKELLRYQVRTAKDEYEIGYLKEIGMWEKHQEETFVTKDGYTFFFEDELEGFDFLYSCMKEPPHGDQILFIPLKRVLNKSHPLKSNRHYFVSKEKCAQYIEYHKPKYSEAQVKELELKCIKLKSKLK